MKFASKGSAKKTQEKSTYIVRKGDTLWDISHSQGVTIQQLSKWNKLKTSAMIKPGQKLLVYKNKTPKSGLKTVNRTITYKVRSGDSLARIANKFNVSISEIIKWNKISKNKYLQPGQKLKLVVDVKKT
jgi:membrane-bound lytic murein transglycosylase D